MKVLIGAEFSGVVRDEFLRLGHDAYSCDLLPTTSKNRSRHLKCDIREVLDDGWDLLIAHLPCTYFANSSVRWLHKAPKRPKPGVKYEEARWDAMYEAAELWQTVAGADIPLIAMENPVPHKYAVSLIGKYTQTIQPYQFGHDETKRTCLWLKGLPLLRGTRFVPPPYKQTVHLASPGPERWAKRSITYRGIAKAMAEQWGSL